VRINDTTVDLGCYEFYSNTGIINIGDDKNKAIVYPNPAHDYLRIVLASQATKIEMSDIAGKLVAQYPINSSEREISMSVSHLSKGIYFLNINNSVSKIIIR